MLVRIVDSKEKVHWVNQVHVKVVTEGKKGLTIICLKHEVAWGTPVMVIKTRMSVDDTAALLNLGMPDSLLGYPPPTDEEGGDDGGNAAATAALMG